MAQQRQKKTNYGSRTWHGFINNYLTRTDIQNVKDMVASGEIDLSGIGELAESGYDFKISWDARSDCLQVVMMGQEGSGENNGWALSARHVDLLTAFCEVIYSHRTFSDENNDWQKPLAGNERFNY